MHIDCRAAAQWHPMNKTPPPPRPEFPAEPIDPVASSFKRFIHTEVAGGVVLLAAALVALTLANLPLGSAFEMFWSTPVGLRIGEHVWEYPLRHWLNDGLVTLFFFVVGLEIKREIVTGELSAPGALMLPLAAAVGGMVVPAAVYLAIASGPQAGAGWGVVMATDIAFVVGCLALVGRRIPDSLRVFVLALAIVDDIGAILVIAVGYSHGFHAGPFMLALGGLGATVLMRWLGVRAQFAYWLVGLAIWAALHESGIHPTIAGVALGLLTPVTAWIDESRLQRFLSWARKAPLGAPDAPSASSRTALRAVARAVRESISPQQRLEDAVHPWSAFLVLPLFALANAGVAVSAESSADPIALAVVCGLVIGKPLGIVLFSWLAVTAGLARLPADMRWGHVAAAGMLAGIGFTMALFIAGLAFDDSALDAAKIGILLGSSISGLVGMALLLILRSPPR